MDVRIIASSPLCNFGNKPMCSRVVVGVRTVATVHREGTSRHSTAVHFFHNHKTMGLFKIMLEMILKSLRVVAPSKTMALLPKLHSGGK